MLKIMGKIFQLILLPLILAGAFFIWSLPRITNDYNFNTDEFIYLTRSEYWTAYKNRDFTNPIWSDWGSYDQPQLTNYIYAQVPGDRSLLNDSNSICNSHSDVNAWSCLGGKPLASWPDSTGQIREMIINGRMFATGISGLAVVTTYYLGLVVAGPLTGILAAVFLGWFSFFKNLSTMIMMDQILLVFLNLQLILALQLTRKQSAAPTLHIGLGLFTGLALSTKLSAAIPTIIIYAYLLLKDRDYPVRNLSKLILAIIVASATFLSLHPPFWGNPLGQGLKMLNWRTQQIKLQESPEIKPTGLVDKFDYTLKESFTSWKHEGEPETTIVLLIMGLINSIALVRSRKNFTILSLLNLVAFIIFLPLKWNRYLLPIMPILAVIFGSLPLTFYQLGRFARHNLVGIIQFLKGASTAVVILSLPLLFPQLNYLALIVSVLTVLLLIQGYTVTRAMLFGFSSHRTKILESSDPISSFSLIVPAREEDRVISHTIESLSKLNYPQSLYEILIMIRADDYPTLTAATKAIKQNDEDNIRIIEIDGDAHNKSYSLNIGLKLAKHDIIGIFDAEDDPHPNILQRVNDYLAAHPDVSAVQAPVHLTNVNSSWFASLNAIEYYYWFRSVLPFLATKDIVLLGGNTIFTRKSIYRTLGNYDEQCLTEDADLGIRLATHNLKIGIIDDPSLATKEEAPTTENEVIRQRSRWDQGYLQIIEKSHWRSLTLSQRFYALYSLSQPLFRHLSFLNMVFTPLLASLGQIPLWIALFSFTPAYFLIIQLGLYLLGLQDLSRLHKLKLSIWRYLSTILVFVPYQALLTLATFRALGKMALGNYSWDKTSHTNSHRESLAILK